MQQPGTKEAVAQAAGPGVVGLFYLPDFVLFSHISMFWSIFFSFLPVLIKFWHNKFQIMLYFHSCQDTIRLPLG